MFCSRALGVNCATPAGRHSRPPVSATCQLQPSPTRQHCTSQTLPEVTGASRRQLLMSAGAVLAATLAPSPPVAAALTPYERGLAATLAPSPPVAAALTPYERGLALQYGLRDGRIRSCETDANPNCVSTASGTNSAFMPPWEAPQGRPTDAAAEFEAALREVEPQAVLVDAASLPDGRGEYRRWQVPSLFDHDDIEVLIASQSPPYEAEPPLVTFRSQASQVKYIWPLQQAVTDLGAQRSRLKAVRQRLGWRLVGCDLVECYEE